MAVFLFHRILGRIEYIIILIADGAVSIWQMGMMKWKPLMVSVWPPMALGASCRDRRLHRRSSGDEPHFLSIELGLT